MAQRQRGGGESGLPPGGVETPGSGGVRCQNCGEPNPEGAKFCPNCGAPVVAPQAVAGERKFATVLFADVADSTAMAEKLDPEEWAEIMNGAFAFLNGAITKYGGTVGRLMGDAVLAFFGTPVAHEDDPERAVRAALEIRARAMEYSQVLEATRGLAFNMRVGVNTGLTVLTLVGDRSKTEYTAMGDAANLAARLQGLARPNTILIGPDTYSRVRHLFDVTSHGAVRVKGKAETVETFEVLGEKAAPGSARGVEGLSSPLVGRNSQAAVLRDRLDRLRNGEGGFVAVTGDAGLGKSRLIAELRGEAASSFRDELFWIEGRGLSYGQSIGYYPWQQAIRQALGVAEKDMPQSVRDKLRQAEERLGLPEGDVAFLEVLLAVESEDSLQAVSELDPDVLQERIVQVVGGILEKLARSTPVVLVFDDLHWADGASLELLAAVAGLVEEAPLLVLTLLRPERQASSWAFLERVPGALGERFTLLELEPLGGAESRLLLGNLLDVGALPEHVRVLALEKAEGNPFFLEEFVRALIDAGYLVRENGRWRATEEMVDVAIPDTLTSLLSARIDRLPEDTRQVAQAAAVIGRSFAERVLAGVVAGTPAERAFDLSPHLRALTQEELVRERAREPELEYIFKHALTQEAAYDRLLLRRRKELHRRTAEVLERIYAERLDEFAPLLAYHHHRSESWLPAARYAMMAGGRARTLHAFAEALDHYRTALQALEKLPDAPSEEVIDATLGTSEMSLRLRRHEQLATRHELREQIERALELARPLGDKRRLTQVLVAKGSLLTMSGMAGGAFEAMHEASALATELDDEQLFLLPYFVTTGAMVDDDPRNAAEQLGHVVEMARKYHNKGIEAHALAIRASAYARLGEFRQAEEDIALALELAPQSHSLIKEADVNIVAGGVYFDMGELQRGFLHSTNGTEKAVQANGPECVCAGYFTTGLGRLQEVNFQDALRAFRAAAEFGELSRNDVMSTFMNLVNVGRAFAQLAAGDPGAVGVIEEALQQARASHEAYGEAYISEKLGEGYLRLGRHQEALGLVQTALDYYRRKGMRPYVARSLDLLAVVREGAGDAAGAAAAKSEARSIRSELQDAARQQAAMPGEASAPEPPGTRPAPG